MPTFLESEGGTTISIKICCTQCSRIVQSLLVYSIKLIRAFYQNCSNESCQNGVYLSWTFTLFPIINEPRQLARISSSSSPSRCFLEGNAAGDTCISSRLYVPFYTSRETRRLTCNARLHQGCRVQRGPLGLFSSGYIRIPLLLPLRLSR